MDAGEWINGKKSGEWTTYNPDGTVKQIKTHKVPA